MIEIQALTPQHPSFLEYVKTAASALLYNSNIEHISHCQLEHLLERAERITLSSLSQRAQSSLPKSSDNVQYIQLLFPNSQ
jgi:hypothetical protein